MTVVAAGAIPRRFPGGIFVVRAIDFLAAPRGTLTTNEPDAQATSGTSVEDAQTAGSLAAADDTLSIPFSALPIAAGEDYRVYLCYRCTGDGADDGAQHLTGRHIVSWGAKNHSGTTRTRSSGSGAADALNIHPLSRERPWFGIADLTAATGAANPAGSTFLAIFDAQATDTLSLAVFKTEGSGAILLDQLVFMPLEPTTFTANSARVLDYAAAFTPSPVPDHVILRHDETDAFQAGEAITLAGLQKVAAAADAEIMADDPATNDGEFLEDGGYSVYALARVDLKEAATVAEDHFEREHYGGWGVPDTGSEWYDSVSGTDELLAYVGPKSPLYEVKGHWTPAATYEAGDLVEGSDGNGYVAKVDMPIEPTQDPTTDATHTFWDPLAGGHVGIVRSGPAANIGQVQAIQFDDLRCTFKGSVVGATNVQVEDPPGVFTNLEWWPWGVAARHRLPPDADAGLPELRCQARLSPTGDLRLELRSIATSGGETLLAYYPVASPYVAGDEYWTVCQIVGAEIKAKMWKDGTTEPDWQIELAHNGMNEASFSGFRYVFGHWALLANVSFAGVFSDHWILFDDFKLERVGGAPEAGHVALTRAGGASVLLQDAVPANRNWAWLYLGRATPLVTPGPIGADLRAWSPSGAAYWQAVNCTALYSIRTDATEFVFDHRAERG